MADVTISDAELAELKQAHGLLKSLYGDASVSLEFKKLVKKKFPQVTDPSLDALQTTEALGGDLSKRFGDLEKNVMGRVDAFFAERKKEKEDGDVNAFIGRVQKVSKDRGYTQEGTEKLLNLMKDRGIRDPEDAAVIFESTQPKQPAKPRSFSSKMAFVSPDGDKDEKFKQLMSDPEGFMVDEMMAALAEGQAED